MNILQWHTSQEQYTALAQRLEADIQAQLTQKERITLCLCGGSTPSALYELLSLTPLDWHRIDVLLSDERWVPENNELSNLAMLSRHLKRENAHEVNLIPYYKEGQSIASTVAEYNQGLDRWMPIDICLLGMGNDAHFASLFADMHGIKEALDINKKPQLVVANVPSQPVARISFNLSALLTASHHYLLIKGNEKRTVLEAASKRPDLHQPISYLVHHCPNLDVYHS